MTESQKRRIENLTQEAELLFAWEELIEDEKIHKLDAINELSNRFRHFSPDLQDIWADIMHSGKSLSDAINLHGENFSPFTKRFIMLGEPMGELPYLLDYAATTAIQLAGSLQLGHEVKEEEVDLMIDFRILNWLISGEGMSFSESCRAVASCTSSEMRPVWLDTAERSDNGQKFSEAMRSFSKFFPPQSEVILKIGDDPEKTEDAIFQLTCECERRALGWAIASLSLAIYGKELKESLEQSFKEWNAEQFA